MQLPLSSIGRAGVVAGAGSTRPDRALRVHYKLCVLYISATKLSEQIVKTFKQDIHFNASAMICNRELQTTTPMTINSINK